MTPNAEPNAIVRRLSQMRAVRQPHEVGWLECCDYTYPERGDGLNGQQLTASTARAKQNRILDDTAADSSRTLASSIVSGTTPANSIWFGLDSGNEGNESDESSASNDEDRWLDGAARFLFENIHASNFDSVVFEFALDLVIVGWPVMYVDEAPEGGYNFEQWPTAQCNVASSKPGGMIDTILREVEFTVEQAVTEYGIDNVSHQTAESYRNEKFDEKVKIIHAIYPRKLYAVGGKMAKNLPFASVHVEATTKHLIKESGYHEFPCMVPRWLLIPGSPYAKGAVAQALGSIRTLNDIKALELANLDMATAGMWIAEDDGVLNPRTVKVGPRRIIVANSVDSMKPLTPGTNFNVAFTSEDRLQAAIRKILLSDQLQPQDGPAMTATEVHARMNLIRQLLGPIYGRLQAEYLQPLIARCFGIAYRAGVLGTPPESLRGKSFTVRFISPLARAQKLEEVSAIEQYVAGAVQVAQFDPEIMDTIDLDAAQKVKAKALGVPARVIPSDKVIAMKRKQRKQDQMNAQSSQVQGAIATRVAPELVKQAVAA